MNTGKLDAIKLNNCPETWNLMNQDEYFEGKEHKTRKMSSRELDLDWGIKEAWISDAWIDVRRRNC